MTEPDEVEPLAAPPNATVRVPGSKSFTNRALVSAALADGHVAHRGRARPPTTPRRWPTTWPACASPWWPIPRPRDHRGGGHRRAPARRAASSWTPACRARRAASCCRCWPSAPVATASTATSRCGPGRWAAPSTRSASSAPRCSRRARPGHLPVTVGGPVLGGSVEVPGDVSSQFLSGLLLAAPAQFNGGRTHALPIRIGTGQAARRHPLEHGPLNRRAANRRGVQADRRLQQVCEVGEGHSCSSSCPNNVWCRAVRSLADVDALHHPPRVRGHRTEVRRTIVDDS